MKPYKEKKKSKTLINHEVKHDPKHPLAETQT